MLRRLIPLILALLLLAAGLVAVVWSGAPGLQRAAATEPPQARLVVFAAASLTEAFAELGRAFEARTPGVAVTFNFAGSQQLLAQLGQGAAGDVFAPAGEAELQAAVAASLVKPGSGRTFARNHLIVIAPLDNPADLVTPADLARPGLKLVLADPTVPAGRYAVAMLDRLASQEGYSAGYRDLVLANVVSREQSVKGVVSKVVLGEADAGIVYVSDVSMAVAGKVHSIPVPEAVNPAVSYPIAPMAGAPQPELAGQFMDFVLSQEGQDILATYGFARAEP